MAILGYNRRLGFLVAAAALWALFSIGAVLGLVRGGKHPPPISVSLGVSPGGVVLHGELTAVEQADNKLKLTIARPPDDPQDGANQPALPDDLAVAYVRLEPGAKGAPGRKPPRISLGQGLPQPRRLPGGDFLLLTDRYAVKFGRGLVRVFPRPAGKEPWLLKRLFGGPDADRGLREGRPPDGMPPGPPDGPPPGPQPDQGRRQREGRGGPPPDH